MFITKCLRVSIAALKHNDQKAIWEENVYLAYISLF